MKSSRPRLVSRRTHRTLPAMCAAFELNSRVVRPGKLVRVWRAENPAVLVWAGFVRREFW